MTADLLPTEYICRRCTRVVDADMEPSPSEPRWCADCDGDERREAVA